MILPHEFQVVASFDALGCRVGHNYGIFACVVDFGFADALRVFSVLFLSVGKSAEDLLDLRILSLDDFTQSLLLVGRKILHSV